MNSLILTNYTVFCADNWRLFGTPLLSAEWATRVRLISGSNFVRRWTGIMIVMILYLTTIPLSHLRHNHISSCAFKSGLNDASMYTLRVDKFMSTIRSPLRHPRLKRDLGTLPREITEFFVHPPCLLPFCVQHDIRPLLVLKTSLSNRS